MLSRLCGIAWFVAMIVGLASARPVAAQTARPRPPAKSPSSIAREPSQAASEPVAAPLDSADAEAKARILDSPRWRTVTHAFYEWLSAQNIYPASQVPRVKAQFNQMVRAMNAQQLQAWLDEMEEKLNVLNSPQAQDAREWLGNFVSAKVVIPERELKKFDILHMTTAQLREAIDHIEERKASLRSESQAFNVTRQEEVRDAIQQAEQQQAQQAIGENFTNRTMQSYYPGWQSQYAPRRRYASPVSRGPMYWVSPWGGIGFTLP